MYTNIKLYLAAILCSIFFFSCAEEKDESNKSVQERILEAYLDLNYPGNKYMKTASGLIILSHQEGKGLTPVDGDGAYIRYSVKTLDGNYEKTTVENLAQQLGVYSATEYYGPELAEIGYGKISRGMHEALCMMREGGKMTIIIPPHLSSFDYNKNYYYGYDIDDTPQSSVNKIYEIELVHTIGDVFKFQTDSLERFRDIHYPGVDSTVTGYYFKKLSGTYKDTIPQNETASVWYVGKLLDGYVFDTNIADTAKKYGIYDASSSYTALSVSYESTFELMSSEGSESGNGYVTGFARALKSMTYGDHAVTFFWSKYGYGADGNVGDNGGGVPGYSMLFFDIYLDEKQY